MMKALPPLAFALGLVGLAVLVWPMSDHPIEAHGPESQRHGGYGSLDGRANSAVRVPATVESKPLGLHQDVVQLSHFDDRSDWSDFRKRLYDDRITRSSHPAEYPIVIEGLAKESIMSLLRGTQTDRAARFCGLANWQAVEDEISRLEERGSSRLADFESLVNEALRVASLAEESYALALEDPMHFEVIDRDHPAGRLSFQQARQGLAHGQYRFSHSTSQGDRAFTLHFDSAYFPYLEQELIQLKQQKDAYWDLGPHAD